MIWRPSYIYSAFYMGQFLYLGVQLPFFPGWLSKEGFSESAIGLVMGGSLILRLLLGPIVAFKAEGLSDQRIALVGFAVILAICSWLMLMDQPLFIIATLTIISMWGFGCIGPLTDTAVIKADKVGLVNYGRARGLGSFAFIIANLVGGYIITRGGDDFSVLWMAVMASLTVWFGLMLPKRTELASSEKVPSKVPSIQHAIKLFRSKSFILMLIATGMTQGAHATYYYFSELHWSNLGYSSTTIGALWSVGVIVEIGLLFYGKPLMQKYGPVKFIMAGALASIIRWPLIGLSPPLSFLVLLQCLHALTFAATYIGSVEFISRAVPSNLANTGMTIVASLGVGALTGISAIIAGQIFTPESPLAGYMLMSVMGIIGFIASLLLARRWDGGLLKAV